MQNKVLLYIEQPPPMHGMTYINKIIYNNLKDKEEFVFYDTNFTLDVNEVGNKSFKKVLKNIAIMIGAWRSFFMYRPSTVYSIVSASLFGIIRDFMINLPAILFKRKLVLHMHGFTYYKIYQESKVYKILFDIMSNNNILIVLCEKQNTVTMEIMEKKSVVLHNCLDTKISQYKKVKNEILQICYISNISKSKGTFELVRAVQSYNKDIKLIIAGDFLSDKDEFLELIVNDENISYVGFANKKKKDELLSCSDIFCLPSYLEEGSPISIIEAMSYGLPVIASDKGCIKDMIQDIGFVLKSDFIYKDIQKGIKVLEDNYCELSHKVSERYSLNYSEDAFTKELINILKGENKNV